MKIIAEHGFWLGRLKPGENGNGYYDYENQDILKKMRALWGRSCDTDDSAKIDAFAKYLEQTVPANTPWVYKTGIPYYPVWQRIPCKKVMVRRNFDSVAQSNYAKTNDIKSTETLNKVVSRLKTYYRQMDQIESEGVPVIDTDAVVAGDYATLKAALEVNDIQFRPEIADSVIDRNKWRH